MDGHSRQDCWKTEPKDRPTFESLVFRLEDFFHSTEANYTDPQNFIDESEDPSKLPEPETEHRRLESGEDNSPEDAGTEDGGDGGGGDDAAAS